MLVSYSNRVGSIVGLTEWRNMSTLVVIGGTGYAGSAIVAEAARRGHTVSSVSRAVPADALEGVTYLTGGIDANAAAFADADVIVAALSPRGDNAGKLVADYHALADAASTAGARFFAIGGFSSLRPAAGAPRFAEGDDLPPAFAAEGREMNDVRADLEESAPADLDWLFISPAAGFGAHRPDGAPHGTYRVGGDVALFDEQGESAIERADFALAIVDEIEKPAHHREQLNIAY